MCWPVFTPLSEWWSVNVIFNGSLWVSLSKISLASIWIVNMRKHHSQLSDKHRMEMFCPLLCCVIYLPIFFLYFFVLRTNFRCSVASKCSQFLCDKKQKICDSSISRLFFPCCVFIDYKIYIATTIARKFMRKKKFGREFFQSTMIHTRYGKET